MSIYESYAFYTKDGESIDGLTVTCDIYSSASGIVVINSSASNVGGGFYKYTYDAPIDDNYLFLFKTADATVDAKQIGSLYSDKTEVPNSVWTSASRTLSSFGTLVSDISTSVWSFVTRTLTSFGGDIGGTIWSYPSRSLSQVSVDDPHYPALVNTAITFYTYASNSAVISSVADEPQIWFTVKKNANMADSESLIQISKTGGLLYLNGQSTSASSSGCIVVVSGNANVYLDSDHAPLFYGNLQNEYKGEIKVRTVDGSELIITQFPVYVKQAITHS